MNERDLAEYVSGYPRGWLGGCVNYARSITDAPLMFHVAGGLAALAGAVGSSVSWQGGGGEENWPNVYFLLLAPSGEFRKSTSVNIPMRLLERACPGTILPREFSPEQFVRNLQKAPTSVLKESEFSSLLERFRASYMSGMKQKFTDLYDCHQSYERTIQGMGGKGESIEIIRPALSILGASTLDWLVESLDEVDMRSGFMPRFLFVPASDKEPEPEDGYWAAEDERLRNALIRGLAKLRANGRATVDFSPVRGELKAWTAKHRATVASGDVPPELGGLYSRLPHHLAKVCALLLVADQGAQRTYEATPEYVERAGALLDWVVAGTNEVFERHLIFSKFERLAQKALGVIGDGIDYSKLLKRMRMPTRELEVLLKTLCERQEITMETVQTTGRGRTVIKPMPGKEGEESAKEVGKEGGLTGEFGEKELGNKWEESEKEAGRKHLNGVAPITVRPDMRRVVG